MAQVRVLTLDKDQFQESVLYRLEKGWLLRFTLGSTLMGRQVLLYTNYPKEDEKFDRTEWRQLEWTCNSKYKHDDLDKYTEIDCSLAGGFGYYFVCVTKGVEEKCGDGYFQIAPTLRLGTENLELPLDCIQAQTMLAKCLGPFPEWEARLRVAHESGYNMVHLTPVNELGKSNSSYSLRNQFELNHIFSEGQDRKYTFDDLKLLSQKVRNEWGIMLISDVVYNHTSNNSPWLLEHPECSFNLKNSPHLRPAFVLDRMLANFAARVAKNECEHRGLPAKIDNEHHLNALRALLLEEVLVQPRFHEFYQLNVDAIMAQFTSRVTYYVFDGREDHTPLHIEQDPEFKRLGSTIDMELAMRQFGRYGYNENEINALRNHLYNLNNHVAHETWLKLVRAAEALIGHVRYHRVSGDGPQLREYNETNPLFTIYFTYGDLANADLTTVEKAAYDTTKNSHFMAHNGWVMNDDPLKNFAEPHSNVYFERGLICWDDSVKLRYGQGPQDCPYLWHCMERYTKLTAETFYGFRIDNCHSTPIHVAEHMLSYARTINPELYICAELFTGSDKIDNIFVNRLGITSLIREAQVAPNVYEQSRLVYRYGGDPVGAFIQKNTRPLTPCIAHAMFMDLTHDNPSPIKKRTIFDLLPTAALVASACCSVGSNRGYDEFVPYHIDVVTENRLYCKWTDSVELKPGEVNISSGMIAARRMINDLHWDMGAEGYTEIYVDKVNDDAIAVTRHNPKTRQSVVVMASTCFSPSRILGDRAVFPRPLHIFGNIDEIIFEAKIVGTDTADPEGRPDGHRKGEFIVGEMDDYHLDIKTHLKLFNSDMVEVVRDERMQIIEFKRFLPGSVIAFKVSMLPEAKTAIRQLRTHLNEFGYRLRSHSIDGAHAQDQLSKGSNFGQIIAKMNLQEFNRILFRSNMEEKDEGKGGGVFILPSFGEFLYCGLAGQIRHFTSVRLENNLGHPLCSNIRDNDWLVRYISTRLQQDMGTEELGYWFETVINSSYIHIPHYLKPCFIEAIISGAYNAVCETLKTKFSGFVQQGGEFINMLAFASTQFAGFCKTARLPPLSSEIAPPSPPKIVEDGPEYGRQACTTISAGLPHFATGLFRIWGRDTFIALPGILLVPGRYDEARYIILGFAGCLRHGLIPNLLGEGRVARYNCRDAIWWWLHAIRQYCLCAPDGINILKDKVRRVYLDDDAEFSEEGRSESLCETMQEALQRHFDGIDFIERNAGPLIDEHMATAGFNVTAAVAWETGFVFGGNADNCGTWMDKMGSSAKAGNKGHPATPRDGAAVELVGLCAQATAWLDQLHQQGLYPHDGVTRKFNNHHWTWQQWSDRIKSNFERCFWIPVDQGDYIDPSATEKARIAMRGIIKDSYGASTPWADYQFRPNFCILLAVAPDLLDARKARVVLDKAKNRLLGPLGMKTLDESDLAYHPYYNNDDSSDFFNTAQGFNYHQGPEWVWVAGYYFLARLRNAKILAKLENDQQILEETAEEVKQALSNHYTHMSKSDWMSLPELTNKDGAFCGGSCPAQAWSVGCILEVVHELTTM